MKIGPKSQPSRQGALPGAARIQSRVPDGGARLAPALAESLGADAGAEPDGRVRFVEMPVKAILNRCDSPRMPFGWTINPYRGCEFGCVYCYARYTHKFLELRDPMDFERRILVKARAPQVLAHTLARTPVGSQQIALGTATDPYQPAERKFGVTRSLLSVFARLGGLQLSLTTKSALITRDLDLLRTINERSSLSINFSLTTLNRRLLRMLEPRAPRPELRLAALSQLNAAGIRCNLLMMPVIPGLTDDPGSIARVIEAAKASGASAVWWRPLFLKPAAAHRFVPFIADAFPHLKERIEAFYGKTAYVPKDYDEKLRTIFEPLLRRHGFPSSREPASAPAEQSAPAPTQLGFDLS